ncbi:MAG TPA: hypothetical protein VFG68_13125 [Fimbriiglobus sp.]|nr:hypothetical protein [Fimbriiglobus sp.]
MNATVTNCAACRGFAEMPFTYRTDADGNPTGEVLCRDCHEALAFQLVRKLDRRETPGGRD